MSTPLATGAVQGLVDSRALAERLGVSQATIRSWRSRGADWLPEPVGRLDGFVWREEDLVGIEALAFGALGRPAATTVQDRTAHLADVAARRARGAYFTPKDAAHFMASWLVRGSGETYLEPSLGDGAFVEAVSEVAAGRGMQRPNWIAAELDRKTVQQAMGRGLVDSAEVRVGDFLALEATQVHGVIANPPYVRLRHLEPEARERALRVAAHHLGISMAPSGSIWMPFLLHMVGFVKLGGRLAVVLPLDFTYVAYALPLWRFLADRFSSLRVLRSKERIFGDINQDVMILLAEGRGGNTDHIDYEAYTSVDDLIRGRGASGGPVSVESVVNGERAFQRALLPNDLNVVMEEAAAKGWTVPASDLVTFRIGYVAGDKQFFHPSSETAGKFNLPTESLKPSLINARKLRGHGLRTSGIPAELIDHLWLPGPDLTAGERRYVRHGEDTKVSEGYKARIRPRWYEVPGVRVPDAIVTVFSEQPLLLINDAEWVASNSLLCAYVRDVTVEQFAAAWYNPLTTLSIGLEVHSLGGGVVIMVPNEASSVEVLHPSIGGASLPAVQDALSRGDVSAAYAAGASVIKKQFGSEALDLILAGTETLNRWRTR